MYKEYRDVTLPGAVSQMYQELQGRYRARFRSVQILKTAQIAAKDAKRDQIRQFLDPSSSSPSRTRSSVRPSASTASASRQTSPRHGNRFSEVGRDSTGSDSAHPSSSLSV